MWRWLQLLAEVYLDMLMGRDDCLRSLRMLLREVVRNVKHDMVFHTFATSLMHDQSDAKLRDLDPILKASACSRRCFILTYYSDYTVSPSKCTKFDKL